MLEPTTKDFNGNLFVEFNEDYLEKFVFTEIDCLGHI